MRYILPFLFIVALAQTNIQAEIFVVNSQQTFNDAQGDAMANDSILWETGVFPDIYMEITKDDLYVGATTWGGTVFNGSSYVKITGDYVTLEGFQFVGGDIGTKDIINTYGDYTHFNQLNLKNYTCYKYLRIREECQYGRVTYCNFENRLNLDDQNILSILVDDTNPGYHKVQWCSFKNFDGTGNDLGIEPIRIGVSTQADFISRSLVEYCYFTQCNGDGELISSKATQNVYRYNTFEDNPKAELVLRHGSEGIVYGNFFINGKGGVRIREGQDHYIYNNYFYDISDRPIYIQNEDSDPLDNINVAFNTIINCDEMILGGDGNDKPTNVVIANNIFADPQDDLFEEQTGTETWLGNIAFGGLGIPLPASGITIQDPFLESNAEGFWGLAPNSTAIDAAVEGYKELPQFDGMEVIDTDISFDLMIQNRPELIGAKDLGANEYPHDIVITPHATEENTGPTYDTDLVDGTTQSDIFLYNIISVFPNPAADQIEIDIILENTMDISIDIFDMQGKNLLNVFTEARVAGERSITADLTSLSSGVYTIRATVKKSEDGIEKYQTLNVIKL